MPVNYSKFDKIVDSDDEKEKEPPSDEGQKHSDLFPSTELTASEAAKVAAVEAAQPRLPSEDDADFVAAARYGDIDDIKAALLGGAQVDTRDQTGAGALLMASANGHMDVVQCLLEARASTEVGNPAGNTPLHWAALNGRLEICKVLLEAQANPNARNEFKRRPFDEAFGRTHTEICEFLATKTDFNDDAPEETPDNAEGSAESATAAAVEAVAESMQQSSTEETPAASAETLGPAV